MSDYYQILGIPAQAGESEIRSAFHQKSLALHPDRNPDPEATEEFKLVTEAYEILSDNDARAAYDEALLGYRNTKPSVSIKDILEGIGSAAGLFMEAHARANPTRVKAGACPVCKGTGELAIDLGVIHISKQCAACEGAGKIEVPVGVEDMES